MMGAVRIKVEARFVGRVVSATISQIADRWFASILGCIESELKRCRVRAAPCTIPGPGIDNIIIVMVDINIVMSYSYAT
jgi:hypothetical protein